MRRACQKLTGRTAVALLSSSGASLTVGPSQQTRGVAHTTCSHSYVSSPLARLNNRNNAHISLPSPLVSNSLRHASSSSSSSAVEHAKSLQEADNEEGGPRDGSADNDGLSTDVSDEAADDFDYVEASCQEIHDIVVSMASHRRNIGGPLSCTDYRRIYSRNRKGLAGGYKILGDAVNGQNKFADDYSRLCQHLTQDTWNRLMSSSSKYANNRQQARNKGRFFASDRIPSLTWECTAYPAEYQHAPHELLQLRSDIPSFVVENARCARDLRTMRLLTQLTKYTHEFTNDLTARLTELTLKAPKVDVTHINRTSGLSKPFGEED